VLLLASLCFIPYGAISWFSGGYVIPHFGYTAATYREIVQARIGGLVNYITAGGSTSMGLSLFSYLVVVLAGAAMAVSGAVYQGLFVNPMASPTTLGVQAGGMLAGIVYILCFYDSTAVGTTLTAGTVAVTATSGNELVAYWQSLSIFQRCGQQLFTLAGCFLGVMVVLGISLALGRGKLSSVALLLTGSIFSTVITEIGQLAQYYLTVYDTDTLRVTAINALIGGSYLGESFTWYEFVLMAVPILLCIVVILALAGKINILAFGREEARAMGVQVQGFRNVLVVACTILSATTLAFCGQVAMVGFMTPHFARFLVGPDFKKLVPASALLGGIVTLLVYDLCYLTGQLGRFNLYTGVVCSVLSVFFIVFYRRERHGDWA
jgi:iron complex transport system permease protein